MRISHLRLNGFKSFVDPTDLAIREGLTGVVGPNGCGKSNLLEALRWVMGENRASAMRGEGMEDVIFAGTASRGARAFAEVALSIDNADRLAPAGFNEADRIEVTRRITRDAGSAFRVNAREVRARDVQMLFADASTGAHSPALVRQGQISELISARPRARRRILEEAAGIAGLYQRRHEAELKLGGAEQNLTRVDDVIAALAAQIAALARQARAAARYREIGAALRRVEGWLLYRRWGEADEARVAAEAALARATAAAARAGAEARAAQAARTAAEERLPPLREEAAVAGAVLQRLAVERDALAERVSRSEAAIVALAAAKAQLARDMEREAGLNRDAGQTIAALEREAGEIAAAGEGHEGRLALAAEAAGTAARQLAEAEALHQELTEDMGRLAARHHAGERLIADQRAMQQRAEAEAARARETAQNATAALARTATDQAEAETAQAAAQAASEAAEAALTTAEAARADLQARESTARAARSEAEGEAGALRAEVAALSRLVEREARAGAQIIDLLRVEPGHEAALGAALAEDLRAPEIPGDGGSGWAQLPDYAAPQPLPPGIAPLAPHVAAPEVLARRLAQIGLVADRAEGGRRQAELAPGQRLVSPGGDLWRWDGFRAAAGDTQSAATLRLRQLNRLVELRRDLEDATARAEGARLAHESLGTALRDASAADAAAREARREADRRAAEAGRALSRAEAERQLADGRRAAAEMTLARLAEEGEGAAGRLAEAEAALAGLPDLAAAKAGVEAARRAVEAARAAMIAARGTHDDTRRTGEARARRGREIAAALADWHGRLDTADRRIAELGARSTGAAAELAAAEAVPAELAAEREKLAAGIATAEARQVRAADALAAGEREARAAAEAERAAERAAGAAREESARAGAVLDAAAEGLQQAAGRIEEAAGETPESLFSLLSADADGNGGASDGTERTDSTETGSSPDGRGAASPSPDAFASGRPAPTTRAGATTGPDIADITALEAEAARLRRQREALGAVNLRAEEDAAAARAEHDLLAGEKADLEAAIGKLRAGIASLNREGRERLLAAFEQVNGNFRILFTHLFGGGEAGLVLVESDDPLEAGLEIMCQPPGKKLSTLSLLSGGEQTLTALALIFAVFLANPAPICVLDEVDAPLDDANVGRFCDLLDEMTRRTQTRFLVITHHAVTMSRMDRLFGVTMAEPGVSQLVSVDLGRAAALVA